MTSHLDRAYTLVRDRVAASRGREDWLEASFHVVEQMPIEDCRALLDEVYGRALVKPEADIAQMAATRLNEDVSWWTSKLAGGEPTLWTQGRGE